MLRVEGSVFRYPWDLESWGSWCRGRSYWFFWKKGASWISGANDKKECSRTCQGPENMLLCSEVLEERIKRRGVCLVGSSLDMKKMELLVDKGRNLRLGVRYT